MKKFLTLALAMLMVLSLAACGSTGTTEPSTNSAASTEEGGETTAITTCLLYTSRCVYETGAPGPPSAGR